MSETQLRSVLCPEIPGYFSFNCQSESLFSFRSFLHFGLNRQIACENQTEFHAEHSCWCDQAFSQKKLQNDPDFIATF